MKYLEAVLVLAGIKLIFFIVACMVLCWICAENSFDNTGLFLLPLSSAYTEPRPFLLLTSPTSKQAVGAQGAGRGHSQDS